MLHLYSFGYFQDILPSVRVRAFTVLAGPIPPELTADTLMNIKW